MQRIIFVFVAVAVLAVVPVVHAEVGPQAGRVGPKPPVQRSIPTSPGRERGARNDPAVEAALKKQKAGKIVLLAAVPVEVVSTFIVAFAFMAAGANDRMDGLTAFADGVIAMLLGITAVSITVTVGAVLASRATRTLRQLEQTHPGPEATVSFGTGPSEMNGLSVGIHF